MPAEPPGETDETAVGRAGITLSGGREHICVLGKHSKMETMPTYYSKME
jgi:hypothetical protein